MGRELELSEEQVDRIDEIDNAVYELCKILTENEDLEWDMSYIGEIAEVAIRELIKDGHIVRYPAVVTVNYQHRPSFITNYSYVEDMFFLNNNASVDWMCFEADSNDRAIKETPPHKNRFTRYHFTFKDILDAYKRIPKRITIGDNEIDSFFWELKTVSKKDYCEIGTEAFDEAQRKFLERPNFVNLSYNTMIGLVKLVRGGKNK